MTLLKWTKADKDEPRVLLCYSPPKQGKTVAAATISEHCPELPAKQLVDVPDVLFWNFDRGGKNSLAPVGINAPYFDMSGSDAQVAPGDNEQLTGQKLWVALKRQVKAALNETEAMVRNGTIKCVVLDTLTAFDTSMVAALERVYSGQDSKIQMWGEILTMHRGIGERLLNMNVNIIVNCHAKYMGEPLTKNKAVVEKEALKKAATFAKEDASVVPDLSGKAKNYWEGQSDIICTIKQIRQGNKVKEVYIEPFGGKGCEGGGRYSDALEIKEPADYKEVLAKVDRKLNLMRGKE